MDLASGGREPPGPIQNAIGDSTGGAHAPARQEEKTVPYRVVLTIFLTGSIVLSQDKSPPPAKPGDLPVSADPRIVVERFASAPDIVHPIACDFDLKGRLLVVESHTHFRPA